MSQSPPMSLEAERAVLGGLLLDFDQFQHLSQLVTPDDFYSGSHARIWSLMADCAKRHETLDVLGLANHMMASNQVEEFGGLTYATGLPEQVPSTANLEYYANIVRDHAARRRIIQQAQLTIQEAMDGKNPVALAEGLAQRLGMAAPSKNANLVMVGDALDEAMSSVDQALLSGGPQGGIRSGLRTYDELAGPLLAGEVYLIAGRPGSGKTSLAQMILLNAARHGMPCLFASLEMPRQQVVLRLMSNIAFVSFAKMVAGRVDVMVEWPRLEGAAEELSDLPLQIDDTAGQTVSGLRRSMHAANRESRRRGQGPIKLLVVDYLQLMTREDGQHMSDTEHLGQVVQGQKIIAKNFGVPVIGLVQLSRKVEERADKRPVQSDIQGAGAFEQVTAAATGIYRDDYYNPASSCPGEAEIILMKSRHGPTGTARARFISDWTLFTDLPQRSKP